MSVLTGLRAYFGISCLLVLCFSHYLDAQERTVVIKAARLYDGKSGGVSERQTVLVEGMKITAAGSQIAVPPGATVVDLGDATLMPGLIDAHTHIVLHQGDYDSQSLRETPEYRALVATASARRTLEAGITTIRDLGNEGAGLADIALRDAINRNVVEGPRMLTAIQPIAATGSYQLVGFSPYAVLPSLSYEADGPAEIRKQVRRLTKLGADVIKVYLESYEKKQTSQDSLTGAMGYSADEYAILVEEAHRSGLRVAAHVYSDEAARVAVAAGVNSVEHGLYLSEETFRLMAQRGVYFVPTLLVYELWRDSKIFGNVPPQTRAKLSNTVVKHIEAFRRALRTRVKIVFGTDTFELPGSNAQELELMTSYGMSPLEALRSATSRAAELLGIEGSVGTVEAGKLADLIAVEGNPLQDVRVLQHPIFVMKEGKIIVHH